MSRLPPWTGDDAAMLRWLDHKLDDLIKEDGAKARARRALPLSSKEKQALFPEDSDESGRCRGGTRSWRDFYSCPRASVANATPGICSNHMMKGWRLLFWR